MGWSIKKPLGNKGGTILGGAAGFALGGPLGAALGSYLGSGLNPTKNPSTANPGADNTVAQLQAMSDAEEAKRNALGVKQQQQILDFANQQQSSAADYRKTLAQSLSDQGQQTFALANPSILEDLNSRGLFTSQTARDQSQAQALKEIALANQGTLTNYDLNTQNQINDLKSSGLSALLGGEQSAVDTALGLRQSAIQDQFQNSQNQAQSALAQWLAQKQSRTQLTSSLLGAGGSILGGEFSGGYI